ASVAAVVAPLSARSMTAGGKVLIPLETWRRLIFRFGKRPLQRFVMGFPRFFETARVGGKIRIGLVKTGGAGLRELVRCFAFRGAFVRARASTAAAAAAAAAARGSGTIDIQVHFRAWRRLVAGSQGLGSGRRRFLPGRKVVARCRRFVRVQGCMSGFLERRL